MYKLRYFGSCLTENNHKRSEASYYEKFVILLSEPEVQKNLGTVILWLNTGFALLGIVRVQFLVGL